MPVKDFWIAFAEPESFVFTASLKQAGFSSNWRLARASFKWLL